jgi:hypothetical protein
MARRCDARLRRSQHVCLLATMLMALDAAPALAHAGERGQVLLLPTKLYIIGGALAVAFSFAVMAFGSKIGSRPPRTMSLKLAALPHWLPLATSTISFGFVAVLVLAGLFGNTDPLSNPLPPMLWTLWWVGFTALTAVVGNLWKIFNPWIGPYDLMARAARRSRLMAYPESLGCLPALMLFFSFAWFELVYPAPQDPTRLATAVIVYSLLTFAGLLVFGPVWLDRGDAFSVFFAMVSRLSPARWTTQPNDASIRVTLELGWPGAWLTGRPLPLSGVAFVLLALSTVSFDGLSRTFAWIGGLGINPLEYPGRSALLLANTFGLALGFAALSIAYLTAFALGRLISRSPTPVSQALGSYVVSLVPIALAFHFAHYLPNLLLDWRHALRGLSDPFGLRWDLLAASSVHPSSSMSFDHAAAAAIYNVQTFLIVLAHMLAVFTAHRLALSGALSRRDAVIGQAPMLVLMIVYTVYGLWLLSTPVVG